MFKRNIGSLDQAIRLILSVVLFIVADRLFVGAAQIVAYIFAVILLVTGLDGFCLIYKLVGLDTLEKE